MTKRVAKYLDNLSLRGADKRMTKNIPTKTMDQTIQGKSCLIIYTLTSFNFFFCDKFYINPIIMSRKKIVISITTFYKLCKLYKTIKNLSRELLSNFASIPKTVH